MTATPTMTMTACARLGALLLIANLMFAGSAAAQVSQEVRNACERKADDVRPMLNAPQREAFIANCIADATWSPGTQKKKDKSY